MNLLSTDIHRNLRLLSRNEGKIKTYESCSDVRAWSHDLRVRDRYLREWIKRDMPICVLPCHTLSSILRIMTCRSRARTTPRCHPDCKSKVVLESICSSCHVIKECLKNEPSFDRYFAEEEFETSHWPCDKCLDVLKSIKMFWKIIVEKIFGVTLCKSEEFDNIQDSRTENVKSVAKLWEKELIQQAMFVKNVTPLLSKRCSSDRAESPWKQPCVRKETTTRIPRPCKTDCSKESVSLKFSKIRSPTNLIPSQRERFRTSDLGRSSCSFNSSRRLHRCTSVRAKVEDKSCEVKAKDSEEFKIYKKKVEVLQQRCYKQETEIEKLKKENNSLKIELQNFYNTRSWRGHQDLEPADYDNTVVVPKPFESYVEEAKTAAPVKTFESEMIITLKNCRNKSYKHVSLLQVLHKTNEPLINIERIKPPCSKKENPIDLLNKVQNTFGEIVRREIILASTQRCKTKHSNIDATFDASSKLRTSRSAPSCSTIFSETASSDSNYISL